MASGLAGLMGGYGSDDSGSDSDNAANIKSTANESAKRQDCDKNIKPVAAAAATAKGVSKGGSKRSNDSDSSSSSGEEESEDDNTKNAASSRAGSNAVLPSVDDLFSNTAGPDFLTAPGAADGDFVVEAMKKQPPKTKTDASGGAASCSGAKRGREAGAEGHFGDASSSLSGVKKPKGGVVEPTAENSKKKKAGVGEKISAKDKVKNQRLKGQSGIGSDFRVWKSDLEMTMRQQYD